MSQRFATLAIALAALTAGSAAMAQTTIPSWGAVQAGQEAGKTRQEVRAETLQALRTGDVLAAGELGATVAQQNPGQYPAATAVASTSREQVKRELAEAIRHGDLMAGRDAASRLY